LLILDEVPGFLKRLLRGFVSFGGMFHGLLGMFVASLVVTFIVMRGSGAVSVCGEIMELGRSLVRLVWHDRSSIFRLTSFPGSTSRKTLATTLVRS
jgi:hypothetical protein